MRIKKIITLNDKILIASLVLFMLALGAGFYRDTLQREVLESINDKLEQYLKSHNTNTTIITNVVYHVDIKTNHYRVVTVPID